MGVEGGINVIKAVLPLFSFFVVIKTRKFEILATRHSRFATFFILWSPKLIILAPKKMKKVAKQPLRVVKTSKKEKKKNFLKFSKLN